jgi:transglutaminase-like putative cysteine protease
MRLNIVHKSEYSYDAPVQYGLQRLHQTPKTRPGQTVLGWRTELDGAHLEVSYQDHLDNQTDLISVAPNVHNITITAAGEVETEDLSGIVGRHTGYAPLWLFLRDTPLTTQTSALRALARAVPKSDGIDTMHHLMALIADRVEYGTGATDTGTTADEALAAGRGVCQDHTHIFVTAARILGYPARYISGFLMMDGQTHQAASHAWAEIHIPDLGWVGFDASNRICADARYVAVATGLDYRDAAPISGIRHGDATETLEVSVIVEQ